MNHARAQDLLSAHLEHDLGEAERAELETHLAACPDCAADLEDLRVAVDLLRRLPDPEPPPFLVTRVMARIAAGETRVPTWRRWLEPVATPLVAAPLAAAVAALAVFVFASPPTAPPLVAQNSGAAHTPEPAAKSPLVPRIVGPAAPPRLVAARRMDPHLIAVNLRGASHPYSDVLAAHFDDPVRAVAYQQR